MKVNKLDPSQIPQEVKLQKFLNTFSATKYSKYLNYVGIIDLNTSEDRFLHNKSDLFDSEARNLIKDALIEKETKVTCESAASSKRRKRQGFEEQSQARILNSDQRLTNLFDYQLGHKNKGKKNEKKEGPPAPKKVKKNEPSEDESVQDESINEESSYQKNRGFTSSLKSLMTGVEDVNSCLELETPKETIHTVYLPFSSETDKLSSSKNLVKYLILPITSFTY